MWKAFSHISGLRAPHSLGWRAFIFSLGEEMIGYVPKSVPFTYTVW